MKGPAHRSARWVLLLSGGSLLLSCFGIILRVTYARLQVRCELASLLQQTAMSKAADPAASASCRHLSTLGTLGDISYLLAIPLCWGLGLTALVVSIAQLSNRSPKGPLKQQIALFSLGMVNLLAASYLTAALLGFIAMAKALP